MRSGWRDSSFGSSRRNIGPGLELSVQWSVTRGEGLIGYVFGRKLKKTGGDLDEMQEACEIVAARSLERALAQLNTAAVKAETEEE